MLELQVSSPVHFGESLDTKWDCNLVMHLSRAFTGSPALSGQRLGFLRQNPVPWWSGLCSPLRCPWWTLVTGCFLSAPILQCLPSLPGLALTHTPGSAYPPQSPLSLLRNGGAGGPLSVKDTCPFWPGSESPAFFPRFLPADSELYEGRERSCLVTL